MEQRINKSGGEMKLKGTVRFVETMSVFPEEKRLIEFCRALRWGEVLIKVKNGLPVMGHHVREDVKFTDDGT